MACEGTATPEVVLEIVEEAAIALAQAVAQADSFCENDGPVGTISCAMNNGTVTAVATTLGSAFASGLEAVMGPDCACDISAAISATMLEDVMAMTVAAAFSETCAGATSSRIVLKP